VCKVKTGLNFSMSKMENSRGCGTGASDLASLDASYPLLLARTGTDRVIRKRKRDRENVGGQERGRIG
jgi:hypothetical protein